MKNMLASKVSFKGLETPFLVRQVETHLIFGPVSRHISLAYPLLVIAIFSLLTGFFASHVSTSYILDNLIFLLVPIVLMCATRLQQAIIGWISTKFSFGMAAFLMASVGSIGSFSKGSSDAWSNLFLGLIWIPWLEFIQEVTRHQKFITIGRLLVSIPCVYFGIKSGQWHWD